MQIAVLTADPLFRSAVEGVAGAMGHTVRVIAAPSEAGDAPLVIVDLTAGTGAADLGACDPLRTAAFWPQSNPAVQSAAQAAGIETFRRGGLVTELPRLIAQRA